MTQQYTLKEAVSVLVSASEVRMQQWEGVAKGERPDALIDELWEVASLGNLEAQEMAESIGDAIDVVNREFLCVG